MDLYEKDLYDRSIYKSIEDKDHTKFILKSLTYTSYNREVFSLLREVYYKINYFPEVLNVNERWLFDIYDLTLNPIVEKDTYTIEDIIRIFTYQNSTYDMEKYLNIINNYIPSRNLENYLLLPVLIFILTSIEKDLILK